MVSYLLLSELVCLHDALQDSLLFAESLSHICTILRNLIDILFYFLAWFVAGFFPASSWLGHGVSLAVFLIVRHLDASSRCTLFHAFFRWFAAEYHRSSSNRTRSPDHSFRTRALLSTRLWIDEIENATIPKTSSNSTAKRRIQDFPAWQIFLEVWTRFTFFSQRFLNILFS